LSDERNSQNHRRLDTFGMSPRKASRAGQPPSSPLRHWVFGGVVVAVLAAIVLLASKTPAHSGAPAPTVLAGRAEEVQHRRWDLPCGPRKSQGEGEEKKKRGKQGHNRRGRREGEKRRRGSMCVCVCVCVFVCVCVCVSSLSLCLCLSVSLSLSLCLGLSPLSVCLSLNLSPQLANM
jgi:hypothetical protein